MCIALPGLVVGLDTDLAVVDTDGRRLRVSTLVVPDVAVGDWVTILGGTIVERLEPDEAAEIQRVLQAAQSEVRA
jgi:hydrogenase assembly chaperone HypC/HupF